MPIPKEHLAHIQRRPALAGFDPDNRAYAIFDRNPDGAAFTPDPANRGLMLVQITNLRDTTNTVTFQDSPDNDTDGTGYTNVSLRLSDFTTATSIAIAGGGRVEVAVPLTVARYLKFSVENDANANLEVRAIHFGREVDIVNRILNDA